MHCKHCGSYHVEVQVGRKYDEIKGIRHDQWMRYVTCHDCGARELEYGNFNPKVRSYCEVK